MRIFPVTESVLLVLPKSQTVWTDLHRVRAETRCEALRVKYLEYHATAGIRW